MILRREIAKRVFRRQLRNLERNAKDEETRNAVSTVLRDPDLFEMSFDAAMGQYDPMELTDEGDPIFGEGTVLDAIKDFLSWIIDNQDSILSFIKAIISLFSEDGK